MKKNLKDPLVNYYSFLSKGANFDLDDYVHEEDEVLSEQEYNDYEQFEEGSFSCDVCERDFFSKSHYDKHVSEHRTCNLDGCKFTAHEKIIENHIRMQHATGLYEKIRNVQTPEDIAKWIEERKKKYPSKENIEKRYQRQEERMKKGLRIAKNENKFGKDNVRFAKVISRPGQRSQNAFNKPPKKKRKPKPPPKVSLIDEKADWNGNMFPFRGTAELFKDAEKNGLDTSDFEDDEWQQHKGISTLKVNNSLSCLMAAYGSDSDDNEDSPPQVAAKLENLNNKDAIEKDLNQSDSNEKLTEKPASNETSIIDSDSEPPDEVKINKSVSPQKNPDEKPVSAVHSFDISSEKILNTTKSKRKRPQQRKKNPNKRIKQMDVSEPSTSSGITRRNTKNSFPVVFKRRKVTLLEKLLQNEIRHERNLLLQCVRYVVENNFFRDG